MRSNPIESPLFVHTIASVLSYCYICRVTMLRYCSTRSLIPGSDVYGRVVSTVGSTTGVREGLHVLATLVGRELRLSPSPNTVPSISSILSDVPVQPLNSYKNKNEFLYSRPILVILILKSE